MVRGYQKNKAIRMRQKEERRDVISSLDFSFGFRGPIGTDSPLSNKQRKFARQVAQVEAWKLNPLHNATSAAVNT